MVSSGHLSPCLTPAPQVTPARPTFLLTPVLHAACHNQRGPATSLLPSGHDDLYSVLFSVELFQSWQIQTLAFLACLLLPVQFSCSVTVRPCPALLLNVYLVSKNAFLPHDDASPASLSGSGKLIFYHLATRGQIAYGNIHVLIV